MRGVAAADSTSSTISVRGSPAERGTRLTRLHQRPWLPRARFCRCSVQLICIESHGPGPPCMTNPATPRLIRVNATLTYPLGRIRMCRARLKTARSAVRSRPPAHQLGPAQRARRRDSCAGRARAWYSFEASPSSPPARRTTPPPVIREGRGVSAVGADS